VAGLGVEVVVADRLAVQGDLPLLAARAWAERYREESLVATQFADPQLVAGYEDGYAMEEYLIGLRQEIPSRRNQQTQKTVRLHLHDAEQQQAAVAERAARRDVRLAWLELWYRSAAVRIVERTGLVLSELVEVAGERYGAGAFSQQQLLTIELEERRQRDRLLEAEERRDAARSELARLIGAEPSRRDLPEELPQLPQPLPLEQLQPTLGDHPAVQALQERVQAARQEAELAGRSYSGFMVDLLYSRNNLEQDRVGLMFSVPLPLAPGQRQDRRAAAGGHQAESMRLERDDVLRTFMSDTEILQQRLDRLSQRLQLSAGDILPHAELVTEAVTSGYQYSTDDFFSVLRSVLLQLESRLSHVHLQADHAGTQAQLLYYQDHES
jgi:outer membrane protein TolC